MTKDEIASIVSPPSLDGDLHVSYILRTVQDYETSLEGAMTEHLKLSGLYWSLTALALLQDRHDFKQWIRQAKLIEFVWDCYKPSTGFAGNVYQPAGHILYTCSALQVLAVASYPDTSWRHDERLQGVADWIGQLQQADGSFVGDTFGKGTLAQAGEVDTRFSYCALQSLALLNSLDRVDVRNAVEYIRRTLNMDGGFGATVGAESHAGQIFCAVAALAIAKRLDVVPVDNLGWWLSERQVDSGGLNGRPEKQADVCYSWWILSSLSILGRISWISSKKLSSFILKCQDLDDGGIADRPDDMPDVFHTFFGVAGLSLLGYLHADGSKYTRAIDPIYALPQDVVEVLELPGQLVVPPKGKLELKSVDYTAIHAK